MFECNEIGMCICVSDQVSDDYVMMEITWRSVGNSVFPLLFLWKKYGRSYSE